jgi:SAM-dependent methyltransferase
VWASPARRRLWDREELPADAQAGWEVTACDISPSMLELARAKAGDVARLSVADMRELPTFGEFDLVWALDDAVNYLLSGEELGKALSGMRATWLPADC